MQIDLQVVVVEQHGHEHGAEHARDEGGQGGARNAHVHAEDEDGVAHDVDHVHDQRGEQRHFRVAHGTEQRCAGVVNAQERAGDSRIDDVDLSGHEDVRFDGTEDETKQAVAETQAYQGHEAGNEEHAVIQLARRVASHFTILTANVLGADHGAARCQSAKDLDQQYVQGVHQGDAGDGCLARGGNHDGIRHADGHAEKLLQYQGKNELHEGFSRKMHGRLFPPPSIGLYMKG